MLRLCVVMALCLSYASAATMVREKKPLLLKKRSADCASEYSELSASHSACLEDVGSIVALSQADIQDAVDQHNDIRAEVEPKASNMNKLVWDADMAMVAGKWAAQCTMGHDEYADRAMPDLPGVSIGQNMYAGWSGLSGAIDKWADELADFTYGEETDKVVGHYTQIVNADTILVGCGVANCTGGYGQYIACNYAVGQSYNSLTKPYAESSSSCSACSDNCDDDGALCDCGGKMCLNGGRLDQATCTCSCSGIYSGDVCDEVTCTADKSYCHLYVEYYGDNVCNMYTNVPQQCPNMCGVC